MSTFSYKFGQWIIKGDDDPNSEHFGYSISNRGPDGKRRFYEVVPGKYGQPIIVAEPDLAFEVPENLVYVNATDGKSIKPEEKIAGIICQNGPRLSLSNAKRQGIVVKTNDDGSVQVGEEKWWLFVLLQKDKNRIRNYDAFCVKEKPMFVIVAELGDMFSVMLAYQ